MSDALLFAYRHSYGGGWSDWIAHRVVSAVIHAFIYGAVFKLLRQVTLTEALVIAGVVVLVALAFGRSRDRRSW